MDVVTQTRGRLVMTTGALVRPRDEREDKYALRRTTARLRAVDLSQPRILLKAPDGGDPRPRVGYQGGMGSCAPWATCSAAYLAHRMAGASPAETELLHAGWLYEQVRRAEGTWPQDVGSYLATNADRALIGLVKETAYRYVDDARFDYPSSLDSLGTYDYALSHRPFYPDRNNPNQFLADCWTALDQGMPIVFGSYWPSEWFSPDRDAIVSANVQPNPSMGGHAFLGYGITPGYLICRNSWDRAWTPNAKLHGMQPGDFLIPWSVAPSMIFEARALAPEAITFPPKPEPAPQPVGIVNVGLQQYTYDYNAPPGVDPWVHPVLYQQDRVITEGTWFVLYTYGPGDEGVRNTEFQYYEPPKAREGEGDAG